MLRFLRVYLELTHNLHDGFHLQSLRRVDQYLRGYDPLGGSLSEPTQKGYTHELHGCVFRHMSAYLLKNFKLY